MSPAPDSVRGLVLAAVLVLSLCSCGTSSPPDPATPSAADQEESKGDDAGTLDIVCNPSGEIKIDGKSIGKSPINAYKTPVGPHDVTCVDAHGVPSTMAVTVAPGESRSVSVGSGASVVTEPSEKK
jgi:hypothetical protein